MTELSVASTWIVPASARITPAVTERIEIDRTVPRIRPESAAAIASRPPAKRRAVPKPTSIHGLYRHYLRFLHFFAEAARFFAFLHFFFAAGAVVGGWATGCPPPVA